LFNVASTLFDALVGHTNNGKKIQEDDFGKAFARLGGDWLDAIGWTG
jgi:hypothetical protein